VRQVALLAASALALALPALPALASTPARPAPAPSPSPSAPPEARCQIPAGLEDDPQEKALYQRCLAQVHQIEDEKAKLADSLALAMGSSQSLQEMLAQTRGAIAANQAHLDQLRQQLADLALREAAMQGRVDATRQRLEARRQQFAAYLRRSYEQQQSLVAALFDSGGVSDFLRRATEVVLIQSFGRDLVNAIRAEEKELSAELAALQATHRQAAAQQASLTQIQGQLVDDEVREATILSALDQSIGDAQKEMVNADSQTADLVTQIVNAEIEREDELIQAANDAAWQAAQAWMASNNADYASSASHSTRYPMIWPAQSGTITQPFGCTDYPVEPPPPPGYSCPQSTAHFHAGIDIANQSGTPIYAADDGVVVEAADSMLGTHEIGYGKHVIIAHHNGVMTLYGHLEGWVVKVGDRVQQGQLIGMMGSTGMSSGPHLHFEVRVNNVPVNPAPYLPPNGPNSYRL
jgi:murein DD-endopeptidase MepM/ murein hydrolase activator NlpD